MIISFCLCIGVHYWRDYSKFNHRICSYVLIIFFSSEFDITQNKWRRSRVEWILQRASLNSDSFYFATPTISLTPCTNSQPALRFTLTSLLCFCSNMFISLLNVNRFIFAPFLHELSMNSLNKTYLATYQIILHLLWLARISASASALLQQNLFWSKQLKKFLLLARNQSMLTSICRKNNIFCYSEDILRNAVFLLILFTTYSMNESMTISVYALTTWVRHGHVSFNVYGR